MLQQNRAEKVGGKTKRKEGTIKFGYQWKNTSGGVAARVIAVMQQFGRIIKWWEQRWRRRWWYYLQNFQNPLDRTDGKTWRLGSMRYVRWIYLPKVLWQGRYFRRWWFFVALASDHVLLRSDFYSTAYCGASIEPLSVHFLYTAWKSFNFFSAYLIEIDQAQLKNLSYDVLLSLWLFSMEIYPKGISLPSGNLPVQIKAHRENIRTKRETPDAYSEICQISKMKLFAKILNSFQLLTIVFIV